MTRVTLVANEVGGFDAVDEGGVVVASGTLELDFINGAQRHSGVMFVTPLTEEQQVEASMRDAGFPVRKAS